MTEMIPTPEEPTMNRDSLGAACEHEALRCTRPRTKEDLKNYVKAFLGVDVPDGRICPDHSSPMDYLWHSFAIDDGLLMKDDSSGLGPRRRRTVRPPLSIIHQQSSITIWRLPRLGQPGRGQDRAGRRRDAARRRLQAQLPDPHPRRLRRAVRAHVRVPRRASCDGDSRSPSRARSSRASAASPTARPSKCSRNRPPASAARTSRSCAATRSSCSTRTCSRPPSSRP